MLQDKNISNSVKFKVKKLPHMSANAKENQKQKKAWMNILITTIYCILKVIMPKEGNRESTNTSFI